MRLRLTRLDVWLLLMTFFWGSNFSVVKVALTELPGPVFNGIRMALACLLFVALIAWREGVKASLESVDPRDWLTLLWLSFIGHGLYQVFFLSGVARTSVSNSALIVGCTPITVSLLSAWLGHERPGLARWAGTAVSFAGICLVVGHGVRAGTSTLTGDGLMVLAMIGWSIYTVGMAPLLARYSPLFITGLTMTLGTIMYLPFALCWLKEANLSRVSPGGWAGIVYSAAFSLVAAYVIWYTAVQRLGSGRTAIYSNVIPLVAMLVAAVVVHEVLTVEKLIGALAVLCGVLLTKLDPGHGPAVRRPA